jgi:tryptophan 2-monooxygenase
MAHIPNIRSTTADVITSHPYIDTPNFSYDQWLSFNSGHNRPLGSIPAGTRVAVIGAGVSGTCASYELLRAGATVDLFDALDQVGGRADSVLFPGATSDLAELGAMRFSSSQFIMDYYLKNLGIYPGGIDSLPDFPDPGTVQTLISYKGTQCLWRQSEETPFPDNFGTVFNGWKNFCEDGILDKNNNVCFSSPEHITNLLVSGDHNGAICEFQKYIDTFGQSCFYSSIFKIFTGSLGLEIPGKTSWSFQDFSKFSSLGIGSGGFGAFLYYKLY